LCGDLIERAAEAGLRSILVGFETLTPDTAGISGLNYSMLACLQARFRL
jgi:hypothetical protein